VRDVTPARAAQARRRWRPVLLSAAVYPGLGQLTSGHPWRALIFGGTSGILLVAFVRRIAHETLARMPAEAEALLDPALPFRLASEIQRDNGSYFLGMTLAIVAIWLASVLDAWRSAAPAEAPRRPRS
jgi:hypothetical protein